MKLQFKNFDMSIDVLFMMAKFMPIEKLAEDIHECSQKFIEDPTEDNKKKLGVACMLFLSKENLKDQDPLQAAEEARQHLRTIEMFKPGKS